MLQKRTLCALCGQSHKIFFFFFFFFALQSNAQMCVRFRLSRKKTLYSSGDPNNRHCYWITYYFIHTMNYFWIQNTRVINLNGSKHPYKECLKHLNTRRFMFNLDCRCISDLKPNHSYHSSRNNKKVGHLRMACIYGSDKARSGFRARNCNRNSLVTSRLYLCSS